jgi:hypothetical protein
MAGPVEIIPLVALATVTIIPITIVLTRHQQKMTVLLRQNEVALQQLAPIQTSSLEIESIHQEVQELKLLVSSLAIVVDNLKDDVRNGNQIQQRVKIGE